jgi:phosphoribosylanthranilate isomerase
MNRVRIKFCGITRSEDAVLAASLGVDALGLVFTARSRRAVSIAAAHAIIRCLPPLISVVALFMDDEPALIREVSSRIRPQFLQFHGEESPAECASHGMPYLKAIPMATVTDVASYAAGYAGAAGFLLDAHAASEPGGQGACFDWTRTVSLARPIVLAGGLDAENVGAAIRAVRPYAVDVSSGIESGPGLKDAARMRDFVSAVRAADSP